MRATLNINGGGVSFRVTPQRQAVLDVLVDAHDHPTATQVCERVRALHPGVGPATVYRTLGLLVADGQARIFALGDGASARYDANIERHDHVVCTGCGAAMDVDTPLTESLVAQMSARTGYDLTSYDLQFHGRCPSCQRSTRKVR
jgi:Fur family ferric uptake transcriptional regulator/Fur family peroxide stress response transcriptional regulator